VVTPVIGALTQVTLASIAADLLWATMDLRRILFAAVMTITLTSQHQATDDEPLRILGESFSRRAPHENSALQRAADLRERLARRRRVLDAG
jgi:hypothetical protein